MRDRRCSATLSTSLLGPWKCTRTGRRTRPARRDNSNGCWPGRVPPCLHPERSEGVSRSPSGAPIVCLCELPRPPRTERGAPFAGLREPRKCAGPIRQAACPWVLTRAPHQQQGAPLASLMRPWTNTRTGKQARPLAGLSNDQLLRGIQWTLRLLSR